MLWKQTLNNLRSNKILWFFGLIAFAYLWGVLGTQHYAPDSTDLSLNQYVAAILGAATALGMWLLRPNMPSRQTLLWLLTFLLVAIQPVLHRLPYVDGLIFPLVCLFLCAMLSFALTGLNEQQRKMLANTLAYMLLAAGSLTILTQFIQALDWEPYFYPYVFGKGSNRLIGNIAQVNQAVFVEAMALATLPYLYFSRPKTIWRNVLYLVLALWLSIGFGFAASRGGLILGLAAVASAALFYQQAWQQRLRVVSVLLALAISGYVLGTYLLNLWVEPEMSAVSRWVAGNQNLRLSQLAQAWHAFSHNPITGVGYGMMIAHGINHAEEIPWFSVSHHVHNIVGQIAAETGLLGLAIFTGFLWLLWRNWKMRGMAVEQGLAYSVLLILGLYSLSEYPLWFLRFMLLVPICIALIDHSNLHFSMAKWRALFMTICIFISSISIYYIDRYQIYSSIYYYILQPNISTEERFKAFHELPVVFGYSSYHDTMLYGIMSYDTASTDVQIVLGERIMQLYFSQNMLIYQANLYALAGNIEQSGKYYRAACVMDFAQNCDKVIEELNTQTQALPAVFTPSQQAFAQWYVQRFGRAMPATGQQQ